jgi:hypothetical protein
MNNRRASVAASLTFTLYFGMETTQAVSFHVSSDNPPVFSLILDASPYRLFIPAFPRRPHPCPECASP